MPAHQDIGSYDGFQLQQGFPPDCFGLAGKKCLDRTYEANRLRWGLGIDPEVRSVELVEAF
jgi:hypothetical protein